MRAVGKLLPMETATSDPLQATGAWIIPFALITSTGAQVTLSILFQVSNVRTPIISLEDLLESEYDSWLELPGGHDHQIKSQRIRWIKARRLPGTGSCSTSRIASTRREAKR